MRPALLRLWAGEVFRSRWLLGKGEGNIIGESRSGSPSTSSRTASFEERTAVGGRDIGRRRRVLLAMEEAWGSGGKIDR
jgi:hypothetical protein